MSDCICPIAAFCQRHNRQMSAIHHRKCQNGASDALAEMFAKSDNLPKDWTGIVVAVDPAASGPQRKSCSTKLGRCTDCSNAGTLMLEAIQADTGQPVSCGSCKTYLMSLNGMSSHDHAAIVQKLYAEISWPQSWRATHGDKDGQRKRIGEIVSGVLAVATTTCKTQRPVSVPGTTRHTGGRPNPVNHRSPFVMGKAKPRFITLEQYAVDVRKLLSLVPHDVDCVAGVARSGLYPASMVAMWLHKPMIIVSQSSGEIVEAGNGWRLGRGHKHIKPKTDRVLVVDDTVMTGGSQQIIRRIVGQRFREVIYATVYCNPAANLGKPDIHAVDLEWPHLLEWNLFNSVISASTAVDFDGVLCHDCPIASDDDGPMYLEFIRNAKPLYLPRKEPLPLIVTARVEKYRQATEEWLKRHEVQFHKLVMHPAGSTREREKQDIPAYKAYHFQQWASTHRSAPGPIMFVESEDYQARRIAQITKQMVICPATAGVY